LPQERVQELELGVWELLQGPGPELEQEPGLEQGQQWQVQVQEAWELQLVQALELGVWELQQEVELLRVEQQLAKIKFLRAELRAELKRKSRKQEPRSLEQ